MLRFLAKNNPALFVLRTRDGQGPLFWLNEAKQHLRGKLLKYFLDANADVGACDASGHDFLGAQCTALALQAAR